MNEWYKTLYSLIMRQRGITVADIADHLGVSRSAVSDNLPKLDDNHEWLYKIDDAITDITDQRGGLDKVVPRTPEGVAEFQRQLDLDAHGVTSMSVV